MRLITEEINEISVVMEENGGNKDLFIEGIFMQCEKKNRNGRIYSLPVMEKAVVEYDMKFIQTGRAVGELNHPPTPTVNLDKVSHLITRMHFEGNNVMGKAKILSTPMGAIAKGLLEGGVKLGVSSRGMGSIQNRGGIAYVGDDFVLNTVDIVADPSAHEAFVNGIMEGAEWVLNSAGDNWVKKEQIESMVKKVKNKPFNEERLLSDLKSILIKA